MPRYGFLYLAQGWQNILKLWLNVIHQFLVSSPPSPSSVLFSPSLTPIIHMLESLPVFSVSHNLLYFLYFVPSCFISAAFFWPTLQSIDSLFDICSLTFSLSSELSNLMIKFFSSINFMWHGFQFFVEKKVSNLLFTS